MEIAIQIPACMAPDHRNTETGDKLCQRAAAALFNCRLQSVKGSLAETLGAYNILTVLLQLV